MAKSYLNKLEEESINILRESYVRFPQAAILFSGGKDSITVTHLAIKAFAPFPLPFPLLHIDTGHNFPEVIAFRDKLVKKHNLNLHVAYVEDSIKKGTAQESKGVNTNRNQIQSITLLESIEKLQLQAAIGGARRDEEKARAKEKIFSRRNLKGQWEPYEQEIECWNNFNTLNSKMYHYRIFPLSNWTELDIWHYIQRENIELPSLYFAHQRKVVFRNGSFLANSPFIQLVNGERWIEKTIRFRTLGDITITGGIESEAKSITDIIKEIQILPISERGKRADDKISNTAMEDRKKQGYF